VNRKKLVQLIATILSLVLLAFVLSYLFEEKQAIEHLKQTSPLSLILLCVITFLVMASNGLFTRELVFHFGVKLSVAEWLGITFVTSLLNLTLPFRGGAAARAVYLKRVHDLGYARFLSTLAVTVAFSFFINALIAAACLAYLLWSGQPSSFLALAFCLLMAMGVVLGLIITPRLPMNNKIVAICNKVLDGWDSIAKNKRLVVVLMLISLSNSLGHLLMFMIAFNVSGWQGSSLVPIVSSAFAKIGSFINITPGGLGIFEAFGVVSSRLVGGDIATSLLAVLSIRVITICLALVLGGAFLPFLWARVRSSNNQECGVSYD
jgi:uncharacterized membrane protein YbhN (UPF0104 family)